MRSKYVVNGDGGEVEERREDGLDEGDDETAVNHKLPETRRPLVRVAPVPDCEEIDSLIRNLVIYATSFQVGSCNIMEWKVIEWSGVGQIVTVTIKL